jgi:hypothetical protein
MSVEVTCLKMVAREICILDRCEQKRHKVLLDIKVKVYLIYAISGACCVFVQWHFDTVAVEIRDLCLCCVE